MHRGAGAGESKRSMVGWQPAGVLDSGCFDRSDGIGWIANAIHSCPQRRLPCWRQNVPIEFGAALAIPPIADPEHVASFGLARDRLVQFGVGRLMPGEGAVCPTEREIDLAQHL